MTRDRDVAPLPVAPVRPDLDALARRLPARPLTRFAPSPTGELHLGHVVNAIYVWGIARALGGRVLLRMEDHDRGRSRREFEASILNDLEWLGLEPDIGAVETFRRGTTPFRQTDDGARFEAALARLQARGLVFACTCSRREIAETVGGVAADREIPYPATCRSRNLPAHPGSGLRLRVDPGVETFVDARLGPCTQDPSRQCGDMLIRDRQGNWTYQFAVTVDDLTQGVDLVVRGEDLVESTGRQIRLARLLGRAQAPVFLHHPLVRGPDGAKLSKSKGDAGVGELREAGVSAGEVLGRAAAECGLLAMGRRIEASELASLFDGGDRRASRR